MRCSVCASSRDTNMGASGTTSGHDRSHPGPRLEHRRHPFAVMHVPAELAVLVLGKVLVEPVAEPLPVAPVERVQGLEVRPPDGYLLEVALADQLVEAAHQPVAIVRLEDVAAGEQP